LAQGSELVEPFVICVLLFENLLLLTPVEDPVWREAEAGNTETSGHILQHVVRNAQLRA
jgi:hypothetical protein